MSRVVEQLPCQPLGVRRHYGSKRMRCVAELAREPTSQPTDALPSLDDLDSRISDLESTVDDICFELDLIC
jgi:hypothetical protein